MLPPPNLWRAEWCKTARRPFNQILLVGTTALLVAFFLCIAVLSLALPERFLPSARTLLTYPGNLGMVAQFGAIFGQLLAAIFVAANVGGEYAGDTWKMILPRYGSRAAFLFAKAGIGVVAIGLLLASLLVAGVLVSGLGAAALGLPAAEPMRWPGVADRLVGVASTAVAMALYGAAALFATVATRSPLAGAMLSFFGLQTVALLSPLYGPLALVMPYPHLPNIIERWVFRDPATLQRIAAELGRPVVPWVSLLVVAGYCTILVGGAALIFHRRDMAGS